MFTNVRGARANPTPSAAQPGVVGCVGLSPSLAFVTDIRLIDGIKERRAGTPRRLGTGGALQTKSYFGRGAARRLALAEMGHGVNDRDSLTIAQAPAENGMTARAAPQFAFAECFGGPAAPCTAAK
jgi:hypothetical protein